MKKRIALLLAAAMMLALAGCAGEKTADAPSQEAVTLVVAGAWPDCTALDKVTANFTEKYPNCQIEYEYIQNYSENVIKRLAAEDGGIHLFLTSSIQNGSDLMPYALELSAQGEKLDLSGTFPGLVDNARLQSTAAEDQGKLYSLPLGAEVRGMFVNKTLLASLGLSVPTNRSELLHACEVLKNAGYVPLQGNPGMFGVQLLYPYICNQIANADDYDTIYSEVDSRSAEAVPLFKEPFAFLYNLMACDYYKYKYCETELNLFTDTSNEGYARSFLNIFETDSGFEKKDDVGQVAFMPFTRSLQGIMAKMKDDYHSQIEYEFILSPVGEGGGYAYMSPGHSIAVNKNQDQLDWSLKFLDYLFHEEGNTTFCETMGYIPNTSDAFDRIVQEYKLPQTSISHLGQVTFSYSFYGIMEQSLIEIAKGNNPKYMDTDAQGNAVLYPFDYYMENFTANFTNP